MQRDAATKPLPPPCRRCRAGLLALVLAAGAALAGGCRTGPDAGAGARYFGPTQTMYDVVREINENNQAIGSLFCKHYFEATIYDEKKESHFVNANGTLMLLKPRDFYFDGVKEAVGKVVEMGSNAAQYWLRIDDTKQVTLWWGAYANINKPCSKEIPIRPDLIMEVLGVGNIPGDFTEPPVPVMRFNNDADAYMLTWNAPGKDRWYSEKEIWYDRRTKLPTLVLLYDANGRVILRAKLSGHRGVRVADQPEERWPKLATDYRLFFPENRSQMWIQLSDLALKSDNGFPKPGGIKLKRNPESTEKQIQLDENCK